MSYTHDQLSAMIDALTTGVANLDGQGLAAPAKGLVSKYKPTFVAFGPI